MVWRMLMRAVVVWIATLWSRDCAGIARVLRLLRGSQLTVNPYLAEESPYGDTDGDGQLTTEEVRKQWEGFMAGVMTAAGSEDWATVIELSYKLSKSRADRSADSLQLSFRAECQRRICEGQRRA